MERRVSSIVMILFCALLFGGVAKANDDANNWGYLQIDIRLEGKQLNSMIGVVKDDLYKPGSSDSLDSWDSELTLFDPDESGGIVPLEGKKLDQEVSPNASRTSKHIKGYFNGTILPGQEPNIVAELTFLYAEPDVGRFGDMPLTLTKETPDGNNVEIDGYRGDIRAEMDSSGTPDFASIPLGKAPAGIYTPDGPYVVHLRLDFEKPLADLNNDNVVNLKDYAVLAKRWREEERSIADISGPNDVPDMVVDYYDLAIVARDWLEGSY